MWYRIQENILYLSLHVRPNAKQNAFLDIYNDALRVTIKAKPDAGKANQALIDFLSNSFRIPKSEIKIIQGEQARKKLLKLPLNQTLKNFVVLQEGLPK